MQVTAMETGIPELAGNEIQRFVEMSERERERVIEKYHTCSRCRAFCCPNPECAGICQGLGKCFACREYQKFGLKIDHHEGYVPPKITGEIFHVLSQS